MTNDSEHIELTDIDIPLFSGRIVNGLLMTEEQFQQYLNEKYGVDGHEN